MLWSVIWMGSGGLIYFVLARPVMTAFTDDPEVIADGVRALRALSISLPFWGISSVNGGALRGSGDTRTPMLMSATAVWASVALAYAFVAWFDGGLGMVWLTFVFTSPFWALGNWLALRRRLRPDSPLLAAETIGKPRPVVGP